MNQNKDMRGIIILVLISLNSFAQGDLKDYLIPAGSVFISGISEGLNHTLIYTYYNFKDKHPTANDKFWNPDLSWRNKYKKWPEDTRAAFLFSKSILVPLTDADHLSRAVSRWSGMIGFSYRFTIIGVKQKWYIYLINGLALYSINRIGFNLSYQFYKP